jgi:hypothetical protein
MTRNILHYCDRCGEKSEVWKRTPDGVFFTYCINKSCPSNRKISIDKIPNGMYDAFITPQNIGTEIQMTYRDASILIAEGRKLGYRGTDWEQSFLGRLEAMRPDTLLPEDANSVVEFYRRATGGGHRAGADHGIVYNNDSGW